MQKKIIRMIAAVIACLLFISSAGAQTGAYVNINSVNPGGFPAVNVFVGIRDAEGNAISGLGPDDFTILENGLPLAPEQAGETQAGVQLVVAFNTATPFGIRDEEGNTRYDLVAASLESWASSIESSTNMDLSLILPADSPVVHASDAALWRDALVSYQPNYQIAIPTLDVLTRAVNIASDEPPQAGMARAILFITPSLEQNFVTGIQEIADQAGLAGLQIFVLLIDAPSLFNSVPAFELQRLAEQTKGRFFTFSGFEPLPDFRSTFEDAGRVYRLDYRSSLTSSGAYEISVVVQANDVELVSDPYILDLQLQPPNAVFLSPPTQILRAFPEEAGTEELVPSEQSIEIIIEFPDGMEREIARTALFANGELVSENSAPPFEQFTWDISNLTSNERVLLHVEVEDEIGLISASVEVPVQISVQRVPEGVGGFFNRFGSSLVIVIALLTGGVLLLVLLLGGRIRPRPLGQRRAKRASREDPVTEPVLPGGEEEQTKRWFDVARRIPRPGFLRFQKPEPAELPSAYLARISENGEPLSGEIFSVAEDEIVFGRDPELATIVLDDPAVEAAHARLWQNGEGAFYLGDNDSLAGSRVNYEPVSTQGRRLKHGDVLHIGIFAFRFTLKNPPKMRRPIITPIKVSDDPD